MRTCTEREVAFVLPGGEEAQPCRGRPIDLAHLALQTDGNRELEREVLGLFLHSAEVLRNGLAKANATEAKRLSHQLKGASRAIGAFRLADLAECFEKRPSDRGALKAISAEFDAVKDYVASVLR